MKLKAHVIRIIQSKGIKQEKNPTKTKAGTWWLLEQSQEVQHAQLRVPGKEKEAVE